MSGIVNEETKAAELESQEQINDDDLSRLVDNFSSACLAHNNNKAAGEMIYLFCATKGKSIKVHKCLFAHKSSVFADMFVSAEMMEQDVVAIPDTEYNVLEEMVRYVYTGKVRDIDALACQLAVVADTYALDGLKTMCEMRMSKNFNLDNVIVRLELAEKLRMPPVMEKAMTFVVANAVNVSAKPEFQKLSGHILSQLFSKLANHF
ncbi:speckle-type POZ protein-like [Nasonia vitripennis]|uniref:BTB domain-containing protein n=1 Tax=Nasonia vitripennis TaxID=7425 RepID=A0A7M7PXU2_NASVI|nr:speckle-type POZ protein-like [Nasonia vitripennis]